jgi:DNA-binding GntR family transcriptional regulator
VPEKESLLIDHDIAIGDQVQEALQLLYRAVVEGAVSPGETTTQVHLAQMLGVGRTPLREALRIAQTDALLEFRGRRIQISQLSAPDLEDLYATRVMLEAFAVRITVPMLRSADFAELEGLLAQMDHFWDSGEVDEAEAANKRLHAIVVSGAQPRMVRLFAQMDIHAERYRRALYVFNPAGKRVARQEHRDIVDAAKARDVDATVLAVVRHYCRTAVDVMQRLDPAFEPNQLDASVRIATEGAMTSARS